MYKFQFWLSYWFLTTGVSLIPDPRTKEILKESIREGADRVIEELTHE